MLNSNRALSFPVVCNAEQLALLTLLLDQSEFVESCAVGELVKYASHNKSGKAWIRIQFKPNIAVPASYSSAVVESVREPRRKRVSRGTDGKNHRATDGYVYLCKGIGTDSYKIGKTINPKSRKATFKTKLPFEIEFVHVIKTDDMHKLEKYLHAQFAACRKGRSEFFNLTIGEITFIKGLTANCTIAQYGARLKAVNKPVWDRVFGG